MHTLVITLDNFHHTPTLKPEAYIRELLVSAIDGGMAIAQHDLLSYPTLLTHRTNITDNIHH